MASRTLVSMASAAVLAGASVVTTWLLALRDGVGPVLAIVSGMLFWGAAHFGLGWMVPRPVWAMVTTTAATVAVFFWWFGRALATGENGGPTLLALLLLPALAFTAYLVGWTAVGATLREKRRGLATNTGLAPYP